MQFIKEKRKTPRKKIKLTDKFDVKLTAEEILAIGIVSQHIGADARDTLRHVFSDTAKSFSRVIRSHPLFSPIFDKILESESFIDKSQGSALYFNSNTIARLANLIKEKKA